VKAQKNDFNDATAIAEVVRLPGMRPVPLRSLEQIDIQALHRTRQRLVEQRTGMTNQIRGLLVDRGVADSTRRLCASPRGAGTP
jgi:transposase